MKMAEGPPLGKSTLWEKGETFPFSHSDFKRNFLQTRKHKFFYGKGLSLFVLHFCFFPFYKNAQFNATGELQNVEILSKEEKAL